ncbi:MFS transporter [Labrys okinawensis]|uniref:MFS transporter n=1 Tax=Labrys okinawensis TaxID=346911 RepID=UPI0039BD4000
MEFTSEQRKTVIAAFLGWTLDAFDFFLLTFLIGEISQDFGVKGPDVAFALTLTLATRWLGAFCFGWLADRFGRKPILMLNIVSYSVIGAAAAFSPNLLVFYILRALFGFAMGGEWGLGSALAMESIPPKARGMVSGMLQAGYPAGYLLAAVVYGLLSHKTIAGFTFDWRGLFLLSILPALIVLFIRSHVPESPAFVEGRAQQRAGLWETLQSHWGVALYAVVLMMFFNLFSHGTQDLYPRFLQDQHKFDAPTVSWITIVANIGAICGGLIFGALSERIGRVNAITIACLIALPVLPLWAYSTTPVMLAVGAFCMQIAVQGAWGVVPAHLNELVPGAVRATLPGFIYQAGNFLASFNAYFQAKIAETPGNSYGYALALVGGIVAVALIIVIRFSPEKRGEVMTVLS